MRTGLWLIGARGSVAVTSIVGALAQRASLAEPIGCVTELPQLRSAALPALSDLVFGGHDISAIGLVKKAQSLGARSWIVFAVGSLVMLHEYVRARGGAAELRPIATNTVADRPTRIWMMLAALMLAALAAQLGPDLAAGAVTLVLLSWFGLAVIGFGQLLAIIRKVLA